MSLYVLDTDHLTLLRKGHVNVVAHVAATPATDIAITVISIEEQFRGWFTQVRKARDAARLARAYEGLYDVIDMAKRVPVLPFSRAAVDRYAEKKRTLGQVGKTGSCDCVHRLGVQRDGRNKEPAGLRAGARFEY